MASFLCGLNQGRGAMLPVLLQLSHDVPKVLGIGVGLFIFFVVVILGLIIIIAGQWSVKRAYVAGRSTFALRRSRLILCAFVDVLLWTGNSPLSGWR